VVNMSHSPPSASKAIKAEAQSFEKQLRSSPKSLLHSTNHAQI
jgi:hypothetical protein